jgi:hypothetical protein
VDRPTLSDDFYRKAEERRKELAHHRKADQRAGLSHQSGAGRPIPTPASRFRSPGVLLVTALGVLALLACAASATAAIAGGNWLQGALSSPASTAQDFYSALQRTDYDSAYQLFSARARAHLSEATFTDQFGGYDAIEGAVTHVSIDAPAYSASGMAATLKVRVTRSGSGSRLQVDQLMLVKEHDSWRIDSISLQFGLTATPTAPR